MVRQDGQITDDSKLTESKVDSNLCFKVEGGRLVMFLLYVDDLFLTEREGIIKDARRILSAKVE